jgi:hypothetical protein
VVKVTDLTTEVKRAKMSSRVEETAQDS